MSCSNNRPKLPATSCSPRSVQKLQQRLDALALAKLEAQARDPTYYPPTPWMLAYFNNQPLH